MVSRPLRPWKLGLVALMGASFAGMVLIERTRDLLAFDLFAEAVVPALAIGGLGALLVAVTGVVLDRRQRVAHHVA
jgi:hypothetical protein